jgi:anti-anti-sigma factor
VTYMTAQSNREWEPFRCEVIPERDAVRVRPVGEIDLATAGQVARALRDAACAEVVLDLSAVSFIDSSGIRMILEARDASLERGSRLSLLPGPPAVQRAFDITGLTALLFP